jgi:tetratricopeptide (TPR) repeat protein
LREGDELSSRNPQAAIETWSRIFLLDLGNADATTRIENARSKLAETNRRVADALKTGRSLYDGGQLKEAREKFLEVLAIDENEPTARSFLQRIENEMSRPQGSYDLSLTSPRGDVLDDDELSPREAPAAAFSADRAEREPPAAKRRRSWLPLGAGVALVVAIGAGLYFVLRPGQTAPPQESARSLPKRRAEAPPPAEPAPVSAGTASAAIPVPNTPPPGADAKRAEAEAALAGHHYIAALTAFNLCASAYPADPGFRQEMGQAADRVGEISPAVKLYNDGDYETALPILWRLYQADHQNEDVRSYLVRAYYDLGVLNLQNNFFDKASRSFADALGVDPNDALAKRQKAFADRYTRKPPDLLARIYVKYLRPRP